MKPQRAWPAQRVPAEIDDVARCLRALARHFEADWVTMTVRPDGRVEFTAEHGLHSLWELRADVHPDSDDRLPSVALREGPRRG